MVNYSSDDDDETLEPRGTISQIQEIVSVSRRARRYRDVLSLILILIGLGLIIGFIGVLGKFVRVLGL